MEQHRKPDRDATDKLPRPSDEQDHSLTTEETLDEALEDSMDASDPPSITQPGDHGDPVASSGFDEDENRESARKARTR